MKKLLVIAVLMVLMLTGCTTHSSESLTFDVETGDSIEVILETGDGYELQHEDSHFFVYKDDEFVAEGIFLKEENKEEFYNGVATAENEIQLENGYAYYYDADSEQGIQYNHLVILDNCKAGVVVVNYQGPEEAQTIFSRLSFAVGGSDSEAE